MAELSKLRDAVVRWKFRVGYFGGFMTVFASIIIFTNTIQDKLLELGISANYMILLPVMIIIFFICAYLVDKLEFIDSEIQYSNSKNKMLKEIHKK